MLNYLKYFHIDKETEKSHDEAMEYLKVNYNEISQLGFERWVSKHLFDKNCNNDIKFYIYILYNYWYHVINEDILLKSKIKELRNKIGSYILESIKDKKLIFTTNFDTILDTSLNPIHLHGCFRLPLDEIKNVILEHYNGNEFEYRYLFGTNGLEKLYRIDKINKFNQSVYNIDFFYDGSINLGDLLIYGIAFGSSKFMSEEFLNKYPAHRDNKLVKTVDGHILYKLLIKYQNKKLNRIIISYYSKNDKLHYMDLFGNTEINNIIEYKKCEEVFNWDNVL